MTPRQANIAVFLAFGLCVGFWSGSVPTVAARSGVTPALLGLATTTAIGCGIAGVAVAGRIARYVPLRRTLTASVVLIALATLLLLQSASQAVFIAAAGLFGFVAGICDGTMNAEASAVERDLGRPVFAGFHAASSFASALGAGVGGAVSVAFGTGATGTLALVVAAFGVAAVRSGTPLRPVDGRRGQQRSGSPGGISLPIVLIGIIAGLSMASEASALMFAASTVREQIPDLAAYAGFGVTAFSLTQAVARAFVDRVRQRFTDSDIVVWSAALAAAGFAVIAFGGNVVASAAGFAVVGIGTAAIVPCSFALAPRLSGLAAAQAIGLLSVVSALPRLPQPIGFGELAATHGFAAAYGLNIVLMLGALALMLILRRSAPAPA